MRKFVLALTFCAIAQLPTFAQSLPPSFVSEPRTDSLKFIDSVQQGLRYRKNPLMTLNGYTQLQAGQVVCIMVDQGASIEQAYNNLEQGVSRSTVEKELLTQWVNILVPSSIRHLCPRHEQAFDDYMSAIAHKHPELMQSIDSIKR